MCELFNNATVAAFFGAFFAFLLVVSTDLRRRYLVRSLLNRNVASTGDLAAAKLQAIATSIALVRDDARITAAPIMAFPLRAIEEQKLQVLDLLSSDQSQAIDALLYWMQAIDELLAQATAMAARIKALSRVDATEVERLASAKEYLDLMSEARTNTQYLKRLIEHYVSGHPEQVLQFKHPIDGKHGRE